MASLHNGVYSKLSAVFVLDVTQKFAQKVTATRHEFLPCVSRQLSRQQVITDQTLEEDIAGMDFRKAKIS